MSSFWLSLRIGSRTWCGPFHYPGISTVDETSDCLHQAADEFRAFIPLLDQGGPTNWPFKWHIKALFAHGNGERKPQTAMAMTPFWTTMTMMTVMGGEVED
ncbi:hypothetical protein IW262DRAFT_1302112 [Armillaria fumosa]|nr:hypothetical protein IW262DRAFT_1302112 [Armillaria fumosa]